NPNASHRIAVLYSVKSPTAARSSNMAAIRSKHTKPEIFVRSSLHRAGYRFSLHRSAMPGNPDLVLRKYATAVFVHGCFWHGHECARGHMPRTNLSYWKPKIARNGARFDRARRELRRSGWSVIVIWECQLKSATARTIRRLSTLRKREH